MNVVALFLKVPIRGAVKTRLAASLGDEGALKAYYELVEFLLKRISGVCIHIHHTPPDPKPLKSWLGEGYEYIPQVGPGLGERLSHAMEVEIKAGADKLVFLGGDCPYVDPQRLEDAFNSLENHDVVLGPASDGGYYLIGLKEHRPELFQGVAWGGETVFQTTLARCAGLGLSCALLPEESDVDDLSDWESAQTFMRSR